MEMCVLQCASGWAKAQRKSHKNARVVELVDSLDSGSSAHSGHAGSSPASRTKAFKPEPFTNR